MLSRFDTPTRAFAACAAAALALRIAALMASPLDLQFDEAQYWYWSRTLDWGYFSKPPLIAWAIATTTALFGDGEWAVRLAAPLAQTGAAVALFAAGRAMYGVWAGFWAGLIWLVMPAVWLSSSVISTDALLMPLWAAALAALWRLHETQSWRWALALGVALGLGALAKYAMLYFIPCAALAAIWAPDLRQTLLSRRMLLAGAVALLLLVPNLIWNALHRFATISHTAANAGGSVGVHPDEGLEFLLGQALVAGPIFIAALGVLFWRAGEKPSALDVRDKLLIAFAAPPLVVILIQAVLSHAHANWAATAYPAATLWVAGKLASAGVRSRTLIASTAVNLALGGFGALASLSPALADRSGLANALEDSRGWRETAALTQAHLRAVGPVSAVMTDHRALFFELSYYWRNWRERPPLRMWVLRGEARNHAEAVAPMRAEDGARVLVVQMQPRYAPEVSGDFRSLRLLDRRDLELGGGETRPLIFELAEGFAPAPRDAAFAARIGE